MKKILEDNKRKHLVKLLKELSNEKNLSVIKLKIERALKTFTLEEKAIQVKTTSPTLPNNSREKLTIEISKEFVINELQQISNTLTIERTRYYISRLIKSLSKKRTSKINDINLNLWKQYDDIIIDSLWMIERRDKSGAHNGNYWGNFVPQIPNQLIRRFTKRGDWVLDTFLGSGTTLIECRRLGRNGIGIELLPKIAKLAAKNISLDSSGRSEVQTQIVNANSVELDYPEEVKKTGAKSIQLAIMHPPYWDIIKFSRKREDLSNARSLDNFISLVGQIAKNISKVLDDGRYLALIIGDKYTKGEWIPLGFYAMQEILKQGYKLKSTIVKNFDETKGKMNQKELWRYRALLGGFYVFKHEYIFLFQK